MDVESKKMKQNHFHIRMSITPILFVAILGVFAAVVSSGPNTPSFGDVWYTQIGQWRIMQNDRPCTLKTLPCKKSFLYHNARIDGARSGQATANVRNNFTFNDIQRYEAHLALGQAPAIAGLLVQNKQVTYYFFLDKKTTSDSLRICRYRDNSMVSVLSVAIKIQDTTHLTLLVTSDSLLIGIDKASIAVAKPLDFQKLFAVGFECPRGTVKVLDATIEARNSVVKESFDSATLVNLHLDEMLTADAKKNQ